MTLTPILKGSLTVFVATITMLFAAVAASAAALSGTSSVTSFTASAATPSFVLTTSSGSSYAPSQLKLGVFASESASNADWELVNTCTAFPTTLQNCGVTSVEKNSGSAWSNVAPSVVTRLSTGEVYIGGVSLAAGDLIRVTFAAGAFTAGEGGNYVVRLTAYDNGLNLDTMNVPVTVPVPTLTPTTQNLVGTIGQPLTSQEITATNFDETVVYSVSPALPAGLSLNTSTGVVSGTPTEALPGTTFTITGIGSQTQTTVLSITINAATLAKTGFSAVAPFGVAVTMLLLGGAILTSRTLRATRVTVQRNQSEH